MKAGEIENNFLRICPVSLEGEICIDLQTKQVSEKIYRSVDGEFRVIDFELEKYYSENLNLVEYLSKLKNFKNNTNSMFSEKSGKVIYKRVVRNE